MTRDRARRLARPVALAAVALTTAYLLVAAVPQLESIGDQLFQFVVLWFLVPGAIVVLRRDGHVIGWLLVVNGLLWAIQLSSEVAGGGLAWTPVAWLAWIGDWIGYAQWTATVALFVLFPDGLADRSPRQRRAGRAMIATASVVTVAAVLLSEAGGESVHGVHANPTGLGFLPSAVANILIIPVVVAGLGSVIGLWRRARHVTGAPRRQYRWVLFAFAVVVAGLVFGLTFGGVLGDAAWLPIVVGWFLIPTAFSIAILRHRLYDIDRLISRTVSYTLVVTLLAALYAGGVFLLRGLLPLEGDLAVATSTLAVAALFNPLRKRVQHLVDRRFNRPRYDAALEVERFTGRLRTQLDPDELTDDLLSVVAKTVQPATASMWIRGDRR